MTSRRNFLIAGTGAIAGSVTACGGARDASGTAQPVVSSTQIASPAPAAPPTPAPPTPAPPGPAPQIGAGGTMWPLGTQTLSEFLTSVRSQLPEGLDSANNRLLPANGILAFCGATIWRDKYSLGIAGGHGDSYDDGHYVQDLRTGEWEARLLPSEIGKESALVDGVSGEWVQSTDRRPASQHSYFHLVTVGDNIIQGYGFAIGRVAGGSKQAHRWNGVLGAWERYGNGGASYPQSRCVLYDSSRNRIVRFVAEANHPVEAIVANDAAATWSSTNIASEMVSSSGGLSIGYHVALDSFVGYDQGSAPNRIWVMDAANIAGGWIEVSVAGAIPVFGAGGLEYIPPLGAFASANVAEADTLYYLKPTAGRLGQWQWTKEIFSGSQAPAQWDVCGPYGRVKWSSLLMGLVMIKSPMAITEVFTPAAIFGK
jgi:hypothetical protein